MVLAVKVICDHVSGKSKGYGFVQFESEAAASTALNEMDKKASYFRLTYITVNSCQCVKSISMYKTGTD